MDFMLVIGFTIAWTVVCIVLKYFFTVYAVFYYFLIVGLVLLTVATLATPWRKSKDRSKLQNSLNELLPTIFLTAILGAYATVALF